MNNPLNTEPSSPEMPPAASPSTASAAQRLQPLERPIAEPFRTSKTFNISKLTLGTLNLVIAIISLGLIVTERMVTNTTGGDLVLPVWLNIYVSFAVASVIWHLTEHITLAFRRDWRSICLSAHVGVHLILWIFAIIVVSFYCLELGGALILYGIGGDCHNSNCEYGPFTSQGAANKYLGIMEALIALTSLMFTLHFILFVMACIETDRRRGHDKKRSIIYLVAAPGTADGRMYYTPLGQPLQENGAVGHRLEVCSTTPLG